MLWDSHIFDKKGISMEFEVSERCIGCPFDGYVMNSVFLNLKNKCDSERFTFQGSMET